ncbi:hypothetical protein HYY75_08655, partial [bacterium]|nr:hypothetical protein [bacterium]
MFTSFHGGIGKSTIAERFAKNYQAQTRCSGAFLEMNLFSPSYIVEHLGLRDKLKNSFMDFFMSNWSGLRAEDLSDTFTEFEKLLIIPFTDVRSSEPLKPRFSFHETDAEFAMSRLLSCLSQKGSFVVIDLPLSFSSFPLFLLEKSDVIYYIYNSQPSSIKLAKRFLDDAARSNSMKEKISLIRNMAEMNVNIIDEAECRIWDKEFLVPMAQLSKP